MLALTSQEPGYVCRNVRRGNLTNQYVLITPVSRLRDEKLIIIILQSHFDLGRPARP